MTALLPYSRGGTAHFTSPVCQFSGFFYKDQQVSANPVNIFLLFSESEA